MAEGSVPSVALDVAAAGGAEAEPRLTADAAVVAVAGIGVQWAVVGDPRNATDTLS